MYVGGDGGAGGEVGGVVGLGAGGGGRWMRENFIWRINFLIM